MSGHSSREVAERLLRKTGVGRLHKPFHPAGLERALRELLG